MPSPTATQSVRPPQLMSLRSRNAPTRRLVHAGSGSLAADGRFENRTIAPWAPAAKHTAVLTQVTADSASNRSDARAEEVGPGVPVTPIGRNERGTPSPKIGNPAPAVPTIKHAWPD